MSKKNGLANPLTLKPFDGKDKQLLRVVIETPKGSRNKFAFDADEHIFDLKKVLPSGMTFPYDFGFVPSTLADDGDPVDVLVLMDEPAFPGCVLSCRPIGVIEGEQGDRKRGNAMIESSRLRRTHIVGRISKRLMTWESNSAANWKSSL